MRSDRGRRPACETPGLPWLWGRVPMLAVRQGMLRPPRPGNSLAQLAPRPGLMIRDFEGIASSGGMRTAPSWGRGII